MPPEPVSYWTAVANIRAERPYGPGGAETRRGTKHFAPGAKVYIIDWYAGMCERITVVGQHRKSKQFITLVIDVRLVENIRAKVCYQPAVIAKIREYFAHSYSPPRINNLTQEFAELLGNVLPEWQAQPWRQSSQPHRAEPAPALTLLRTAAAHSLPATSLAPAPGPRPATPSLLIRILRCVYSLFKNG